MAGDDRSLSTLGVGIGLVLGSAVGALVGALLGIEVASLVGYGTGGGLVVGAVAGRLIEANRGEDQFQVRALGGSAAIGLLVGASVGTVGAWSLDATLLTGLGVGAGAGLLHGFVVAAILLATLRR
jgi:hypothetical protein